MPRAERPLDDDDTPVTRFAADLRRLRRQAGSPTYRQLARTAHYSTTTLAAAAAGRKLPSIEVTLAYVRACGGDPDEWAARWRELAAELSATRQAGERDQPGAASGADDDCPYVGLASFTPADAGRFFGRERLTEDLLARVLSQRFLAVFGASGSGKSSLLRAGLLPALEAVPAPGGGSWSTVLFTPGPHPLDECAVRIAALTGDSATVLRRDLDAEPRALHLQVLQALLDRPSGDEILIVVDQFEEVFTLCADPAERAGFISALIAAAQAANSRVRVVVGVRADFYPACSQHPDLVEALRDAQLLVGPMNTDELRRAISQPAVRAGCSVDSALLARIVADATGQAGALPLVSHALSETWRRRRGNTLTLAGYEAAGGIQHALARTAESVHGGLSEEQRAIARGVFLRLVALGEGTEDTKRRLARADLDTGEQTRAVLDVLAQARLITLDTGTVDITHEALLHAWPRLRRWIDDDRAGVRLAQQLGEAANDWERQGRDPSMLFRGRRLAAVSEGVEFSRDPALITARMREFLAASTRQEQRGARLRRAAVAALAVLTVLSSLTTVIALAQRATAEHQRDVAASEQVLAEAGRVRGTDPSLAAQLSLASYRIRPTSRAVTDMLDTRHIALSTALAGHTEPVYAVAFSPDGRTMATGAGDNTIRLWDVTDPGHPALLGEPLTGHRGWVYWLAFSPDGRTLASASRDRTARLWNVTDRDHPTEWAPPLTGHRGYVFSVSFSGDGRTLVTASYDHTVRLWDVHDPANPAPIGGPLTGHTDSVASAAVSPDGRTVASAGHDNTIRLWNITRPGHPALWTAPLPQQDVVYAVAFSPDSRTLASVGNDHLVRLWDITEPAHPTPLGAPLPGHTDVLLAVAFSHDGRTLATGGTDHTIRLWNVTDPAHPVASGPPLLGHTGIVNWVAFDRDDTTLASVSDDHTVRVWNLPRPAATGHTDTVNALDYRPDGRILASASDDRTIRLWDVHDADHPAPVGLPLAGHTGAVTRVVFHPGGKLLASAAADHTVRLWDLTDPAHPAPAAVLPTGATTPNAALAFHPAADILVTDGPGFALRLWDVHDPNHPTPMGQPLTGPISPAHWAGFSPDGRTLASSSGDDKIRLWNVSDLTRPLPGPTVVTGDTDGILWATFGPDGRVLAAAGAGHTVQLWDLRHPGHPEPLGPPLTGHTAPVRQVVFTPDGRTLASVSTDATVRLWDVSTPAHATPIGEALTAGHTGPIDAAAYSPDGRTLASAGSDRGIELTTADLDAARRRVCATTGLLSEADWEQFLPGLSYDPPCR